MQRLPHDKGVPYLSVSQGRPPSERLVRMTRSAAGWRVEDRLVRLAGPYGLGHRVVDLQDQLLGAKRAVALYILAFDDREGFHDVVRVLPLNAVQVEVSRIQLGTHQEPPLLIPPERRAIFAQILH